MDNKIIKKITKIIMIVIAALIGLMLVLELILKMPSKSEKCYDGESFFCIDKVKHTFHIQTHPGSGNPGTSGFYFYNPITKTINSIIDKDDDLYMYSLSDKKYNVIFQDENFFVYGYKNYYTEVLKRDDFKTIKSNKSIKGLYESDKKYNLSFYVLENDKYIIYNSKNKTAKYISYDELLEEKYFIDVNKKKVYKLQNDDVIELPYVGKEIPLYYNMDVLEKYHENKKDLTAHFRRTDKNLLTDIYIKNGTIEEIYNNNKYEYKMEVLKWNSNYVYFTHMSGYNFRYNVLKNRYEIDEYEEIHNENIEITN